MQVMNNLAVAYRNRIWGDRTQNIEDAIDTFNQCLKLRTREAFPNGCRKTASSLAGSAF
jgi:hypothetical protein